MKPGQIQEAVAGVPHMSLAQANRIYEHFQSNRPSRVLELGFAHGVSTCYMAGALEDVGGDSVVTIDRAYALRREPHINQLLERCGLAHMVQVILTETSYNWELMRFLQGPLLPKFDFVYIDGAHLWEVDGFAFLLVDRLLAPGGWILFDDLNWALDDSPSMRDAEWVRALPEKQRKAKQVRLVYDLLVRTHEQYGEFEDDGSWGWARKLA